MPEVRIPPLSIAADLAGTRILVTGATGFLGTALVERLLRSVPECEVVVLVLPVEGRTRSVPAAPIRTVSRCRLVPAGC